MKEKTLDLYYFDECPYCQIVLSALKSTGLQNKVNYLNIHENSKYKEKLMKDTGRGTVPCLYIDGKPMHESRDIANWLHQYAKDLQKD